MQYFIKKTKITLYSMNLYDLTRPLALASILTSVLALMLTPSTEAKAQNKHNTQSQRSQTQTNTKKSKSRKDKRKHSSPTQKHRKPGIHKHSRKRALQRKRQRRRVRRRKRRRKRVRRRKRRRKRVRRRRRRRKRVRRRRQKFRKKVRRRVWRSLSRQIRRVHRGHYRVSQKVVTYYQARLGLLSEQATVVPYLRSGQRMGFQFRYLSRRSVLRRLGLRQGDIIIQVNGYPVLSLPQAMIAYLALRQQKVFRVVLRRRGKRRNLRIEIR